MNALDCDMTQWFFTTKKIMQSLKHVLTHLIYFISDAWPLELPLLLALAVMDSLFAQNATINQELVARSTKVHLCHLLHLNTIQVNQD